MSDPKATSGGAPYRRMKVFISYRRSGNAGDAERLYDELRRYFATRHLFLDVKSIRRGDLWPLAIETALASSHVFLAVIGPQWLGSPDAQGRRRLDDPSDTLRREVSAALARGAWLIPVLMHGAQMPKSEELPDDMRRLAECQAVEIRSGHWEKDVGELVAILKRRLNRRRRLVVLSSLAAALVVVVAALIYNFAPVALPLKLAPGDKLATLLVEAPPSREGERAEDAKTEATPQEIVVEELSVVGEDVLAWNDSMFVSDVRLEADSGRFDKETVANQRLSAAWAERWEKVEYIGAPVETEVEKTDSDQPCFIRASGVTLPSTGQPTPTPDYHLTCSTSVAVRTAGDGAPTTLRLFQENDPDPTWSRKIFLSADHRLNVEMGVKKMTKKEGYGLGCARQFRFGNEPPSCFKVGEAETTVLANAGGSLMFTFVPIGDDTNKPPPEINFLRLKANTQVEPFDLSATRLYARRVVRRARGVEEVPCGDKLRDPTISYEATSADDKHPLRLTRLEVGANYFSLAIEGEAYVVAGCEQQSPVSDIFERMRRKRELALLLSASAVGILIGFVYSFARL